LPELALHFSVVFALTAPVLGLRRAIVLSLISLAPDLDALFHVHRSMSHSAVLLVVVSLVAFGLVRKLKPNLFSMVCAGCLSLLCHPVMDLFSTYTPILYPLIAESVYISVEGKVLIGGSITPSISGEIETRPTEFTSFQWFDAPLFTNEGFIVSLLLVAIPFLMLFLRRSKLVSRLVMPEGFGKLSCDRNSFPRL